MKSIDDNLILDSLNVTNTNSIAKDKHSHFEIYFLGFSNRLLRCNKKVHLEDSDFIRAVTYPFMLWNEMIIVVGWYKWTRAIIFLRG